MIDVYILNFVSNSTNKNQSTLAAEYVYINKIPITTYLFQIKTYCVKFEMIHHNDNNKYNGAAPKIVGKHSFGNTKNALRF